MKPVNRICYIFLLFAAFLLSVQAVYPVLPGSELSDSNPVIGQKNFALLPLSPENRDSGIERTLLKFEISNVQYLLTNRYHYHRLFNLLRSISGERKLRPIVSDLQDLLCILRI